MSVEVGADNRFLPASADRGQPTLFLKGRHRFACVMVVSADSATIQWKLTVGGEPSTTTAKIVDPLYELESASAMDATAGVDPAGAPRGVCLDREPAGAP